MTVIPRGISAINLLFTSLVRKFVLSLNKSVSSPLQLIFSAPTQVLSLPLSLTLFFFSLGCSPAISEVLYYLETRADLCLCPEQRQVWFTVYVVRDELRAGLVFRATVRTKSRGEESIIVWLSVTLRWSGCRQRH